MKRLSPDEKWSRFNQKLTELMESNDFYGLGITYQEMANFLIKEGKDPKKFLDKAYEMKLIHQKDYIKNLQSNPSICVGVEVLCTNDSCKDCKDLDGKVFDFDKATEVNPLPVKNCTHEYGCRCVYLPVAD
jgi:hypothetical protein